MEEQQAASGKLLSVTEYARRHNVNRKTVSYWCSKEALPGLVKKPNTKSGFTGWKYLIPEDAEPIRQIEATFEKKKGMVSSAEYAKQKGLNKKPCNAGAPRD